MEAAVAAASFARASRCRRSDAWRSSSASVPGRLPRALSELRRRGVVRHRAAARHARRRRAAGWLDTDRAAGARRRARPVAAATQTRPCYPISARALAGLSLPGRLYGDPPVLPELAALARRAAERGRHSRASRCASSVARWTPSSACSRRSCGPAIGSRSRTRAMPRCSTCCARAASGSSRWPSTSAGCARRAARRARARRARGDHHPARAEPHRRRA